jgi:hypothetical protein
MHFLSINWIGFLRSNSLCTEGSSERVSWFTSTTFTNVIESSKMILTKAEYHYFPELQATSVQMAANTPDFVQLLRIRFTFLVKFSIKKIKCTGGRELINQKNTVS